MGAGGGASDDWITGTLIPLPDARTNRTNQAMISMEELQAGIAE